MSLGLVGRKVGMTRVFTDDGDAIPVTVVDVSNNRVTQIKNAESDTFQGIYAPAGTPQAESEPRRSRREGGGGRRERRSEARQSSQ